MGRGMEGTDGHSSISLKGHGGSKGSLIHQGHLPPLPLWWCVAKHLFDPRLPSLQTCAHEIKELQRSHMILESKLTSLREHSLYSNLPDVKPLLATYNPDGMS